MLTHQIARIGITAKELRRRIKVSNVAQGYCPCPFHPLRTKYRLVEPKSKYICSCARLILIKFHGVFWKREGAFDSV